MLRRHISRYVPIGLKRFIIKKPCILYGGSIRSEVVYLVRRDNEISGLYSNLIFFLKHVAYVKEMNWLCSIDMLTQKSLVYHEEGDLGTVNVFENYYNQPDSITVLDALNSSRIAFSTELNYAYDISLKRLSKRSKELNFWSNLLRTYFHPSADAARLIKDLMPEIDMRNTLGVSYRYGYVLMEPSGHPIQPSLLELEGIIEEVLRKNNFTYIFLSTDDAKVVRHFKRIYPSMILHIDRMLVDSDHQTVLSEDVEIDNYKNDRTWSGKAVQFNPLDTQDMARFNRPNDKYLKGIEYMAEVESLSKCGGLIGSESNGILYAYLKGYGNMRYTNFLELGKYE